MLIGWCGWGLGISLLERASGKVHSEAPSVRFSSVQLFVTLWQPARLLGPWGFLGRNTGVGCHSLLQGIFPTQGSNPGLLHCRRILYHLRHLGSHP